MRLSQRPASVRAEVSSAGRRALPSQAISVMTPLTVQAGNCAPPLGCENYGIGSVTQSTGHIGNWVLSANGGIITYQPDSRFWPFQFIEAGIFVALTAAALGTTIWLLHRRAA
jgi:hypothetical protein